MTHSFHIPVMGTGFTIDTPLKVARFGISSVVSVDDHLMEAMRAHYSGVFGETYVPIKAASVDSRARRITAYLNFLNRSVQQQVAGLRLQPFVPDSDISRYFELLDESSVLKSVYRRMSRLPEGPAKAALQQRLRSAVEPGSIDVNILTKLDRPRESGGSLEEKEYSDGMAALRGFAQSELHSSVVFSAGLNLHLFGYLESFDDFFPDQAGRLKKRIMLKVSDFRSAHVQGKIFAKKGLWVSEYRIESGLNCGGHAFATDGHLMGPVLEEFRQKRMALADELFGYYREALRERKKMEIAHAPDVKITAQGGIGTHSEQRFLLRRFGLERTGWGSPFLLVPEATSVDENTLKKLAAAGPEDIYLSDASPMGVPIYNLRNSASEDERRRRIAAGRPGSPCLNGFMAFNSEFSAAPLCTASSAYQGQKIAELKSKGLDVKTLDSEIEKVTQKACICHDLGVGALLKNHARCRTSRPTPAICPGPNLVYFSRICSLKEMIDHIYGRANVLNPLRQRSHMFINELRLYLDYFKNRVIQSGSCDREKKRIDTFKKNLSEGIAYYRGLVADFLEESEQARKQFIEELNRAAKELESCAS